MSRHSKSLQSLMEAKPTFCDSCCRPLGASAFFEARDASAAATSLLSSGRGVVPRIAFQTATLSHVNGQSYYSVVQAVFGDGSCAMFVTHIRSKWFVSADEILALRVDVLLCAESAYATDLH